MRNPVFLSDTSLYSSASFENFSSFSFLLWRLVVLWSAFILLCVFIVYVNYSAEKFIWWRKYFVSLQGLLGKKKMDLENLFIIKWSLKERKPFQLRVIYVWSYYRKNFHQITDQKMSVFYFLDVQETPWSPFNKFPETACFMQLFTRLLHGCCAVAPRLQ